MARGDLLLFWKHEHNLSDAIIVRTTQGPFVHVAIDTGDGLVEAQQDGIHYVASDQVNRSAPIYVASVTSTELDGIENGIEWVRKQVGLKYGWSDIVSSAMKGLGLPWYIGQVGHWDCSDLATRYLINANAAKPLGNLVNDPGIVNPNDIALAYGLIEKHGLLIGSQKRY